MAQIEGFRRALTKVEEEKPSRRSAAIRGSYEGVIRQLEAELREYDHLKTGDLKTSQNRSPGRDRAIFCEASNCQGRFTNGTGAASQYQQKDD